MKCSHNAIDIQSLSNAIHKVSVNTDASLRVWMKEILRNETVIFTIEILKILLKVAKKL